MLALTDSTAHGGYRGKRRHLGGALLGSDLLAGLANLDIEMKIFCGK
jgi:hypothetical protein